MPLRTTRPVAAASPRSFRATVVRAVCIIFLLAAAALRAGAAVSAQQFAAGDTATVAAEGDGLLLRDGPGYDASVLNLYPDGTLVAIVEGPITASDGSVWYAVEVEGQAGYMVADWLASPETAPQPAPAPAPEPAPATDQAPAAAGYCDGAQEYIDQAALRADFMRYFAHDVVATGGPMSPLLSLGMASSLYLGHEDQMEWGANWPEWYWPAYEMMDAMANLVNWEFASFPGVYASPDGYNHRAGSYSAALAWADETEQRYIDASTWFIETCGLVWPRLPADPYDYIRN